MPTRDRGEQSRVEGQDTFNYWHVHADSWTCHSRPPFSPIARQALLPLAADLQGAWIYGPVAKQTDTFASDIDWFVNRVMAQPVIALMGDAVEPARA